MAAPSADRKSHFFFPTHRARPVAEIATGKAKGKDCRYRGGLKKRVLVFPFQEKIWFVEVECVWLSLAKKVVLGRLRDNFSRKISARCYWYSSLMISSSFRSS